MTYTAERYTCKQCPEGWQMGRYYMAGAFRRMLRDGFVSPGSVWENSLTGVLFVVRGNEYAWPDKGTLVTQELVVYE